MKRQFLRLEVVASGAYCAALLGTTWLKGVAASRRELWLDETHSTLAASMPVGEALRFLRGDQYPPLYFLLLKLWTSIFSDGPLAVRWLSIVLSLVAALAAFALGRRVLGGLVGGALCGTLFLLSPSLFIFSIEVRAYVLAIALLLIATSLWFDLNDEPATSTPRAVGLGVVCAASFYTHYLTIIPIAVLFALLWFKGTRARSRGVVAFGVMLALIIPLLAVIPHQITASRQLRAARAAGQLNPQSLNHGPTPRADHVGRARNLVVAEASLLGVYPARSTSGLVLLAVPLIALLGTTLRLGLQRDRPSVLFLVITASLMSTVLLMGLESRRYLMVSTPFLVLAMGRAIIHTWTDSGRRARAALLAVGVPAVWIAGTVRAATQEWAKPVGAIVSILADERSSRDQIVFNAAWIEVPVAYVARQVGAGARVTGMGFPLPIRDWWNRQPSKEWGGPVILREDLVQFVDALLASQPRRVWLVVSDSQFYDPGNQLLHELRLRSTAVVEYPVPRSRHSDHYQLFRIDLAGSASPESRAGGL